MEPAAKAVRRKRVKPNAKPVSMTEHRARQAMIVYHLLDGVASPKEISVLVGLSLDAVVKAIRAYRAIGCCRKFAKHKDTGETIYQLSFDPDVDLRIPREEAARRYKAYQKAYQKRLTEAKRKHRLAVDAARGTGLSAVPATVAVKAPETRDLSRLQSAMTTKQNSDLERMRKKAREEVLKKMTERLTKLGGGAV